MLYRLLADATVVLHLGFVVFVVAGGLLSLRWRRAARIHIPAAIWGAWVEFAGWVCPLTPLENWLRIRGGGIGYSSDFVERYLLPALYPATLTREIQWSLGLAVLLFNAAVYGAVVLRARRRRQRIRLQRAGPAAQNGAAPGPPGVQRERTRP